MKKTLKDLANEARARGVKEIDVDGLIEAMGREEGVLVVDVREAEERARGAIPGSVGVGRGVLERDFEKIAFGGEATGADLNRTIVCYCGGGSRSALAAATLTDMGFTRVWSLAGGYRGWEGCGQPVNRDGSES